MRTRLFDLASKEILLKKEALDARVVKLITRQLIAAVQERDVALSQIRKAVTGVSFIERQTFTHEAEFACEGKVMP